jgi:ectoine hydroxylase-related dioxygenase (phytanoyl-CoA dioxygenase family)
MGSQKVGGNDEYPNPEEESYYTKVFTQRLNLLRVNDTVKRYVFNPGLGEMLCQLEGVDGFRVWHDQALIKEPYGNPTAWHLDDPYWSFSSKHSLSMWIALEPATLENGCMWFVPGTHKLASYDNSDIGEDLSSLFKVYPEMAEIDPVAVPMQPGDCSFHNGLTAHGAGANMTRGRRIAMTCAYMPVGATFNGQQNILPPDYFNSLSVGDVLENNEWNPVVA